MEEDAPDARFKRSNSAPDLHLLVNVPMQGLPRTLMGRPPQPFGGSDSAVGALVPYTPTESTLR